MDRLASVALIALPAWVVACGEAPTGGLAPIPDSGDASSTSTSVRVDTTGGTVSVGDAVLVIPAGALPQPVVITIDLTTAPIPAGYVGYSPLYAFGPPGLVFSAPALLTLPFNGDASRASLFWSTQTPASYVSLGGSGSSGKWSAFVSHFSTGFVGARIAGEPSDAGLDGTGDHAGNPWLDSSIDGASDGADDRSSDDGGVPVVDTGPRQDVERDGSDATTWGDVIPEGGRDSGDDVPIVPPNTWTLVAGIPEARFEHGLAYDSARSRIVLFGGMSSDGMVSDETWEWDGRLWRPALTPTHPSARTNFGFVYDSVRRTTVLFGGRNNVPQQVFGDTWEWDGRTWSQRATTGPSARYLHGLTFDVNRAKTVLYGGQICSQPNDTWEWDGTSWTDRTTLSSPPVRQTANLAYDRERNRTVLFGGQAQVCTDSGYTYQALGDTWEWDGTTWYATASVTSPPPNVTAAAITFVPERHRTVLMNGQPLQTWEWDGSNWLQRSGAPPVWQTRAVYGDAQMAMLLFGGVDANLKSSLHVWKWDTSNFAAVPVEQPMPSGGAAMAFDAARSEMVLFSPTPPTTWLWQGSAWSKVISGATPPTRTNAGIAYDRDRERVVVFGGDAPLADTWEWDGTNWTQKTPATSPSARGWVGLVYDELRKKMVMFGGYSADMWEWDGTNWHEVLPPFLPPTGQYTGAFDATRGVSVFVELGSSTTRFTWEWDGIIWAKKTAFSFDSQGGKLVYDPVRKVSVLFGMDKTLWQYDGNTWTAASSPPGSLPRYQYAMSFDTARQYLLMFGGQRVTSSGPTEMLADTWVYRPE